MARIIIACRVKKTPRMSPLRIALALSLLLVITTTTRAWAPSPLLTGPGGLCITARRPQGAWCRACADTGSTASGIEGSDEVRSSRRSVVGGAALLVLSPGKGVEAASQKGPYKNTFTKTGSGLQLEDVRVGTGPQVLLPLCSWTGLRGGLVFKAHRLLYHSTLGLRVIKKNRVRTGRASRSAPFS